MTAFVFSTLSPMQSSTNATGRERIWASRSAHGPQALFRIAFALGPAEVRTKHDPRAVLPQILQRRHGRLDAFVVGDRAVLIERHVVIHAHQHALAAKIFQIVNGQLRHVQQSPSLPRILLEVATGRTRE